MFFFCLVVLVGFWYSEASISVSRCHPSNYICEGTCPKIPSGAEFPAEEENAGLCLKDHVTEACVCWMKNSLSKEQHLQTLFKCEVKTSNDTVGHLMCLPPPICFPPEPKPSCMIIIDCPCTVAAHAQSKDWQPIVAFILRSSTPVTIKEGGGPEKSQGDVREFSLKHLLFLLAFVIAPLVCWCLLTFFHEGKCRRKTSSSTLTSSSPEAEPMPTDRSEQDAETPVPSAPLVPKFESPPPYREQIDPGENCLLAADCGPPPSYEDAIRDAWRQPSHSQAVNV